MFKVQKYKEYIYIYIWEEYEKYEDDKKNIIFFIYLFLNYIYCKIQPICVMICPKLIKYVDGLV